MKSASIERALHLAGGVATAVTLAAILRGLQRASQREVSRQGSRMLTAFHQPAVVYGSSIAGLAVLSCLWRPLPLRLTRKLETALTLVGSGLFFAGIALFHWGRRTMGEMYDVSMSSSVQLFAGHRLVTSGPFAYVRHPLYVAGILAEAGALLMYRTWTTAVIALNTFSLIVRSRREEVALAEEFGDEWTRYAARVPGFPGYRP